MNTALLIIDIQNDYFEGGAMTLSDAESASKNVQLVLEKFRKEHLPIIHIQHIATKSEATFFLPKTYGAEIHKNVQPMIEEKIITKHFPNSFRETDLLSYLNENQITNLIICGMMTHMCVDATTRAANDFGFNCTLISDGCATKDLEINGEKIQAQNVQNSFLAALNTTYAQVISTKTLLYTQNGFF